MTDPHPLADVAADALRPAADASYDAQAGRPPLEPGEEATAARMLGRPLRSRSAAAVRCGWGLPAVLRVDPRLHDGTPFPTTFWLTCPLAVRHVGRLEAEGAMAGLNDRLGEDDALRDAYRTAHERFLAFRDELGGPLPNAEASAGGMPTRVKCLHALYGHWLATGDNPVGEWVGEQIQPMACPGPCVPLGPERSAAERGTGSHDPGGSSEARDAGHDPGGSSEARDAGHDPGGSSEARDAGHDPGGAPG